MMAIDGVVAGESERGRGESEHMSLQFVLNTCEGCFPQREISTEAKRRTLMSWNKEEVD